MKKPKNDEKPLIKYAVRLEHRDEWDLGQARASVDEIKQRYLDAGDDVAELRVLGPPAAELQLWDSPHDRARKDGWWVNPFSHKWCAPDQFIYQPYSDPADSEGLAVCFEPPEYGWIGLTVAYGDKGADIRCSEVFDPTVEFLEWLEKLTQGTFPRMEFDEEGSSVEFHTFPRKGKAKRQKNSVPPVNKAPRLRFVIVGVRGLVPEILLDVLIPRRPLIWFFYRAWIGVQDYDPERFQQQWSRFGSCDPEDFTWPAFPRSTIVENWLANKENQ